MQIIYAGEALPEKFNHSVFLAGPSPRDADTISWRPEAIRLLEEAGYTGCVLVPEAREGARPDYSAQMKWELDAQNRSDAILFWIPRDMSKMPALTTNNEFGIWSILDPARIFLGAPEGAPHTSYQFKFAAENDIPSFRSLAELVKAVVEYLGEGATREGGCCQVALHIWRNVSFQNWYKAQTAAGMQLHGARLKWVFRIANKFELYWAMQVDMFVPAENRRKTNEVVISRPDVCLTVAWHRPDGAAVDDVRFALICEYRTPAVSSDGYAWENPGGSSFKPTEEPRETAASELKQELGLELEASRVKAHCARQISATLSAHRSHVYSVELTAAEMDTLSRLESEGKNFGEAAESERTYPRVRTLKQIRAGRFVDWATVGILYTVLADNGALSLG